MTKLQKRRAATRRRQTFTREWLAEQPDIDIEFLSAIAQQQLLDVQRGRRKLSDDDAARNRRIIDEAGPPRPAQAERMTVHAWLGLILLAAAALTIILLVEDQRRQR